MIRPFAAILAAAVVTFAPLAAPAQPVPVPPPPVVQPGMQFTGSLRENVTSKSATVGQQVTLVDVHSTDGTITNAIMYGQVASVTKAGQGRPAQIQLQFNTIVLPDGSRYAVEGEVMQAQVNTANNGAKEAGATIAGMIVGNILGKWVGTNLGGAVGAAGGY
ncbi:MAG: hypothetical protein JO359_15585, partial [Candidatus Eremiobacteraeota bacterium]|nr:hypothetical protein [Candidatus Eremiobacteraeota bacterium]